MIYGHLIPVFFPRVVSLSFLFSVFSAVAIVDTTYTKKSDATGAGNGILTPTWAIGWSGLQ